MKKKLQLKPSKEKLKEKKNLSRRKKIIYNKDIQLLTF